jgi:hypothetical protein
MLKLVVRKVIARLYRVKQRNPITGPDRPSGFQEVEAVSPNHRPPLPTGNIPGTHFC